jgi:signal transduction histidine kinase
MNRFFALVFLVGGLFFAQQLMGQSKSVLDDATDLVAGYQKLIASGGDYDTLSAQTLNRLLYKAKTSYYSPELLLENFAQNHLLAIHAYQRQEFSEAIHYGHVSLRWATKIGDSYCKASSFRILSDIYNKEARYDSALHYKTQALVIYQQLRNHSLANLMSYQIGNLYFDVNDYDQAKVFLDEFLQRDTRHNIVNTLNVYNRIGRIYHFQRRYDIAIGYFEQAATLAGRYNMPQWELIAKGNIGKVYFKQEKYREAIPLLEASYLSALEYRDTSRAIVDNCTLAETYLNMRNRQKVEKLLPQIEKLTDAATISTEAKLAYMRLRYLYAKSVGNTGDALSLLEAYKQLGDSVNSLSFQKKLEQVRTLNAAAVQQVKDELMQRRAESVERERNLLLIGSLLFAAVVIPLLLFLVHLNRKRRRANLELNRSQYEVSLKNKLLEEQNIQIAAQAASLEQMVKERTRDLESTIKGLNSHNKDLEQFSYIVSHNIRSPVTQILGLINIFNTNQPDDPINLEVLKNLQKSAANLDQVIKDLNIIISTRQSLDTLKEKVDLEEMMRQVLLGLETNITATHASIQYDFTIMPILYTVRGYMHSILHNLISNAIKYRAENRKPHIVVSSDVVGDFCCLMVADNGLGIDLTNTDTYKIFGLYQRMHTHTEGKGLGLYLVKTQVESLGGTIGVESKLGVGTVFRIMLPLS